MSDVTGSLSLVTRQDDSYSLDLISGFLDVQMHCLFESVSNDMNLIRNDAVPHMIFKCACYFLVFSNFYLNVSFLQPCHSQLTLYARNIPNAVCVAPPEEEQVMLETCRGPWFSINWMKSASRWFRYSDTLWCTTIKTLSYWRAVNLYCRHLQGQGFRETFAVLTGRQILKNVSKQSKRGNVPEGLNLRNIYVYI
jgi:hypothetical protein